MCEESHLSFVCKRKSKVQVLHQLSVSLEVKNFRQEESAACLSATILCNIIMTILKNEAGFTSLKINSFCELEVGQYMFTLRNLGFRSKYLLKEN